MSALKPAQTLQRYVQFAEVKQVLDRLLVLQEGTDFQSVAMVSEYEGEGKTFTTAALAMAYTERLKKKVLIVDTATPRPISVPTPAGSLSRQKNDFLGELLEESDYVDVISLRDWSGIKPGGNPDEYKLKALLAQNSAPYSLVLVDTSALSRKNRNNFDPILIARQCDVAILVNSRTDIAETISEENKKRIAASHIKLIGMIHNQGEKTVPTPTRGKSHGQQ